MQIDVNQEIILLWVLAKNYDGTPNANVVSGTVKVYSIDGGVESNILEPTSLSEISDGKWIYEWSPVALTIGQYLIEFSLIDDSGVVVSVLEDLIVVTSNNSNNIDFQYVAADKGTIIELGLWVEENGEVLKDVDSISLQIYDLSGNLISDLGTVLIDTDEGVFKFSVSSSVLTESSPYYLNIVVVRGVNSYEANLGLSVA
jgi:hypothetical protein